MKFPETSTLYSIYRKFPRIVIDSREANPDSIFFSLRGQHQDGNAFAECALQKGCNYAVVDNEEFYKGEPFILVHNSLETLQQLAREHRRHLKIPFLGITGSNGKTTTKELVKKILSKKFRTFATEGNLNNHIGVPLSVLSVHPEIEIAIIEMGANHTGEIAFLCEIAHPDYGMITNIGKAHIGEFGSFENIVKAKTELYRFIQKQNGKIFICADNPLLMQQAETIDKITYGTEEDVFCRCSIADSVPFLKIIYEDEIISTRLTGKYNFENVAAAICVGKYFAVENHNIKKAIEEYIPSNNRSQIVQIRNHSVILDAYNANPSSMQAAIENFYQMPGDNKWLILGDMLELGRYETEEHKKILQLISEKKFSNVILVGKIFRRVAEELKISFSNFYLFSDSDELAGQINSLFTGWEKEGTSALLLIKGSRAMKLEKVIKHIQ